ncbi:MAG: ATP-binding protein [Deltaproteobacteria bacterium]|nr:ATP-binding protein [Deltaproteobacteria bacterium]
MWQQIVSKICHLRRGESPFLQRPLGLQTRITLLFTTIVVSVLVLFSYLDFRLTEHSQRELFRERTIYVTRELDAKIYSMKDLEDIENLQNEIAGWIYTRPSIKSIDIFLFQRNSYRIQVSSSGAQDLGLTHQALQSLKKDLVLSQLITKDDNAYWEILAPIHIGRRIVGGIRIQSSLEEIESFLANKRNRTILFTLTSVAMIILILTLYFSWAIDHPIKRLVQAMSAAEEGRFSVAVPIRSRDELGLLTDHFNRMLARINQFNEELTQRIENATKELAQRNEELRLANESLFLVQRQLAQEEKLSALGHVAATIAHEVGTPLNSISGYIQLMLTEGTGSEVMTKRLTIIESQLDRLAQTIRNLLQSTRQPEPQLQSLDIQQLLEAIITLIHPGISMRGIELVRELDDSLPPVSGDPGLLQQVFLNLVNNAIDAMPEGGVLTIATRPRAAAADNGRFVEVVVKDSGVGMSAEVQQKAFNPFFTTKEPGKGAGLGLAICNEIIRSHHGKLEIESQAGQGSILRVLLPAFGKEVK